MNQRNARQINHVSSSSSPESNRSTDSSSCLYDSPIIINQSSNSHGSLDSNEIVDDDNYNNDEDNVEHYEPSNVYIDRSIDDCNEMIKLLLLEANKTNEINASNKNDFVDLITTQ